MNQILVYFSGICHVFRKNKKIYQIFGFFSGICPYIPLPVVNLKSSGILKFPSGFALGKFEYSLGFQIPSGQREYMGIFPQKNRISITYFHKTKYGTVKLNI